MPSISFLITIYNKIIVNVNFRIIYELNYYIEDKNREIQYYSILLFCTKVTVNTSQIFVKERRINVAVFDKRAKRILYKVRCKYILKRKRFTKKILFVVVIIFIFNISEHPVKSVSKIDSNKNISILVDISEERLYLIDTEKNIILKKYNIASGKAETPSPVGTWKVTNMGKWSGSFGTRWIGLNVPWGIFGIHGTNRPGSIGNEASHGCIRMQNKDVEELYEYVNLGMIVCIYAGAYGPFEKGLVTLKPGDRGADVLEVQRKMKEKGYYPENLDGIYGEGMKQYVIKFRKDNKLTISHNIDSEFYEKLGIKLAD